MSTSTGVDGRREIAPLHAVRPARDRGLIGRTHRPADDVLGGGLRRATTETERKQYERGEPAFHDRLEYASRAGPVERPCAQSPGRYAPPESTRPGMPETARRDPSTRREHRRSATTYLTGVTCSLFTSGAQPKCGATFWRMDLSRAGQDASRGVSESRAATRASEIASTPTTHPKNAPSMKLTSVIPISPCRYFCLEQASKGTGSFRSVCAPAYVPTRIAPPATKTPLAGRSLVLAERVGFEPTYTREDVTGIPVQRLRPLGHLSAGGREPTRSACRRKARAFSPVPGPPPPWPQARCRAAVWTEA